MEAFQLSILFLWFRIFTSMYYFYNQEKNKNMSMNKYCKETSEYTVFVDLGYWWLMGRFLSVCSYFVVLNEF